MLSEREARVLLSQAAETIEARWSRPVPPVSRRTWPVLLAAAVATVVAGAGVVALTRDGARRPSGGLDPTDRVTTQPQSLEPGQVPNVFGYRRAGAVALLEASGFAVQVVTEKGCTPDGRALRTEPGPGSELKPGGTVRLVVAETWAAADCFSPEYAIWPLFDFANGRGAGPKFAGQVVTYVNGVRHVVTAPADPAAWGSGSVLEVLARATTWAPGISRTLRSVGLGEDSGAAPTLPEDLAGDVAGREAASAWMEYQVDGIMGPSVAISVFSTRRGIDTIVLDHSGLPDPDATGPTEEDPDPAGVGAAFTSFARGESDDVPAAGAMTLYLNGRDVYSITGEQAQDRESWGMCSGISDQACPKSAVYVIDNLRGDPAVTSDLPQGCRWRAEGPLPEDGPPPAADHVVVLGVPEPKTCRGDVAVQLGVVDGAIAWANLLYGRN